LNPAHEQVVYLALMRYLSILINYAGIKFVPCNHFTLMSFTRKSRYQNQMDSYNAMNTKTAARFDVAKISMMQTILPRKMSYW